MGKRNTNGRKLDILNKMAKNYLFSLLLKEETDKASEMWKTDYVFHLFFGYLKILISYSKRQICRFLSKVFLFCFIQADLLCEKITKI